MGEGKCKNLMYNRILSIIILAMVIMIGALRGSTVYAQKTYTKQVESDKEFKSDKERDKELLSLMYDIDEKDVVFSSVKVIKTEYGVDYEYIDQEYYSEYPDDEAMYIVDDYDTIVVDNPTDYTDEQLKQYIRQQLGKKISESDITITDLTAYESTYEIKYTLYSESDEYNKSMGDYFGTPSTNKDSKAVLSDVSLYIQGCKVPYLLEDGGEYYVAESSLEYTGNYSLYDFRDHNPKKSFYNLDWKTPIKKGAVIGKIKHDKDNLCYIINKESYKKLSELFPNWRTAITYDKGTKSFIYGEKPDKEEQKLKKDIVYEFTMKATKGCKTTREKIKAIHDAIVLQFSYDIKNFSYKSKLGKKYLMIDNDSYAFHMLQSKKGTCSNYATLFKECCNRLFIPCNFVSGVTSGLHVWNRVYIGGKSYHIDATFADYINNKYKKPSDISRTYFLKSAYDFMGTHNWSDFDYKPYKFSKSWKKIDRNNIKTTEQLRKAVIYASYLARNKKDKVYKFKITGNGVNISCCNYISYNGFSYGVSTSYNNRVLTVTYNLSR